MSPKPDPTPLYPQRIQNILHLDEVAEADRKDSSFSEVRKQVALVLVLVFSW